MLFLLFANLPVSVTKELIHFTDLDDLSGGLFYILKTVMWADSDLTWLSQSAASSFLQIPPQFPHEGTASTTGAVLGCILVMSIQDRDILFPARVRKSGWVNAPVKLSITLPYNAALCSSNDHFISPVVDVIPYLESYLPFSASISF